MLAALPHIASADDQGSDDGTHHPTDHETDHEAHDEGEHETLVTFHIRLTGDQQSPPVTTTAFGFDRRRLDRKSTRLNSSHVRISYAVFCLKKKKNKSDRGC